MKELLLKDGRDLPRDFLRKFWIEPGDDFVAFLSRLKDKGLSFLLEVPDDATNVADLISEQVTQIKTRGGPSVPEPPDTREGQTTFLWEFLSCKSSKFKMKDLRSAARNASGKKPFIEIAASSKMLAPVEYRVKVITKEFGFKDPLRAHNDEPEKFVIIGSLVCCFLFALLTHFSMAGARFPGHCSAGVTGVYNQDLSDDPDNTLWPHGCYAYRLLYGLRICGENTRDTFSKLLERCHRGQNAPMCHLVADPSEDEVHTLHYQLRVLQLPPGLSSYDRG
jgi:hypothetical protein